jgi:hypothetical protein
MLASPVGLIVPLVSMTTLVSSRMTLEAQETKVRVASLFLRHGMLFGLRRMPCLLLLYEVPPYLSGQKASAKRKRDVQRVRGNQTANFPQ